MLESYTKTELAMLKIESGELAFSQLYTTVKNFENAEQIATIKKFISAKNAKTFKDRYSYIQKFTNYLSSLKTAKESFCRI